MGALFKRGQVVEAFPCKDIAELVCHGPAFAKDESVPPEEGYASCVASLAFDESPGVTCCVFGNDGFHEFLVILSIYLSDLKSCPDLGLTGCFGTSPGSAFAPKLSFQFVVNPGLVTFC